VRSSLTHYSPKIIERCPPSVSALTEAAFYLIKLYTRDNEALFGNLEGDRSQLNGIGQIAADEWVRSSQACQGLELDEWIVLPNRLEGIVVIREPMLPGGYAARSHKPRILSSFIASYKAAAAKRINLLRNAPGDSVWQRNYQERLIPDEAALIRVRQMLTKQFEPS